VRRRLPLLLRRLIPNSQIIKLKISVRCLSQEDGSVKMDKIRLLLTVITIAIVVIPIVGMLLAYQDNLLGLFVPPEIVETADALFGGGGDNGSGMEPPTIVGEPEYDEESRTFSVTFQYINSLPIDVTIKSLTGNIECDKHRFPLGNTSLSKPVSIDAGETGTLTVVGTWTEEAISHFETAHKHEETVDVVLVDFVVDISGIKIELDQSQMEQTMQVPNPAYEG
jgi:hypothetical protein